MRVRIHKGQAVGKVDAPPSKSMAHRLLISAGLSEGVSIINGISESEDILATIDCLKSLGAECELKNGIAKIKGVDIKNADIKSILNCRESGSTMRFFIPIALATGKNAVLNGSKRLLSRPLDIYKEICEESGLYFSQNETSVSLKGPLKAGNYKIKGNISSQFISGLLFVLPLLKKDSTITILPPIESRSYIDLTISALNNFGISVVWKDENTLYIRGGQNYTSKDMVVEGDYSNAAFLSAFNYIGGNVEVAGLNPESIQGDRVYNRMFESISKGTPALHISDCPDLGPILFSLSSAKFGGIFTGTERLKIKESDRVLVMAEELRKFGVIAEGKDDSVVIFPKEFKAPNEILNGHNDHRVVMSLAVLLTLTGGEISGADAVKKSFPDFFDKLEALGIKVDRYED
jgi:3-phosphoshikimate 1-carboxyvinyltransferase